MIEIKMAMFEIAYQRMEKYKKKNPFSSFEGTFLCYKIYNQDEI